MPPKVEGLEQLLVEELQDMYDAEKQLVRALPKMAKAAGDAELQNALRNHLEVTRGQVQRLEQVFEAMDMRARSRPCRGMRGIVEEGEEMVRQDREEALLDSGIAGSARKVEHYEIAGYESVRSLAQQLGMRGAAQLLEQTLREEIEADKQLAQISKRLVKEAASAGREKQPASSRSAAPPRAARGRSRRSGSGHTAHPLVDHEQIRQWAEERGARPSCVRGTGGRGDTGMIRLNFPGYSGEESLQDIDWDEWFQKFDDNDLALMVQQTTARGQKSNFNKLVKREHAGRPRTRSAH